MIEENHEKTPVRLVGTGIRTRDLPNAILVRYHGATSLGNNLILLLSGQIYYNGLNIFQLNRLFSEEYYCISWTY